MPLAAEEKESRPGKYLDGRPLDPHTSFRLRPLGHKAVLVMGKYGYVIDYVPDEDHLCAEPRH